ncbi:MAG: recombination regulator RecX [Nitrospirae bacterium YQR-1]
MSDSPKEYAFRLLNFRDRSEKQLRNKLLEKGYTEAETQQTIEYLKEAGLIDDSRLALNLLMYLDGTKMAGTKKAADTLRRRGIEDNIIQETLSTLINGSSDVLLYGYCREGEIEKAKIFVKKKEDYLKNNPLRVKLNKLYGMLLRRGFDAEIIAEVLKEVT